MSYVENAVRLFEQRQLRAVWDEAKEKWRFSVIDIIAALTDSVDLVAYWRKLKQRMENETVIACHGLKMRTADDGMRLTDVAGIELAPIM